MNDASFASIAFPPIRSRIGPKSLVSSSNAKERFQIGIFGERGGI
jgi:hypothetical protein